MYIQYIILHHRVKKPIFYNNLNVLNCSSKIEPNIDIVSIFDNIILYSAMTLYPTCNI